MLRDVFYFGNKTNVHPLEKPARDLNEARQLATTEHFWIVNEYCDYTNFDWDFDFEFLPDDQVWTGEHDNVWPSQHNKDSGTWLCAKDTGGNIIYRQDVPELLRTVSRSDNWVLNYDVDEKLFDFSWYPDPTDPPYIYAWSCRYFPATSKPAIEYHVPGATDYKYMDKFVELKPNKNNYKIIHEVDDNSFDWAWVPDPTHPPYIYVWGNQHYRAEEMPTIEYHVEGAVERKYIDNAWHAKLKSKPELFEIYEDCTGMDYTWRPDPGAPPYIYAWGNQYNDPRDKASVVYRVESATQYKYMNDRVVRKPCMTNWSVPLTIDDKNFDYSWEPNPNDPPYIYEFGTQHQKTNGPRYVVENATEIKYIDDRSVKHLPQKDKFRVVTDFPIIDFDYSWHPDTSEQPYIYVFGNQYYSGEIMPTLHYVVEGATEYKYIDTVKVSIGIKKECWHVDENIDVSTFDFSWIPHPKDPPYIYEFGTQWQKDGGPKYIESPDAVDIKYVSGSKAKALPDKSNWEIPYYIDQNSFDFSWHPERNAPPMNYIFGTQWAESGGPVYKVKDAIKFDKKYIDVQKAIALADKTRWNIPEDVDTTGFDFSWHPGVEDPPYIYEFGTQWQKTGGPRYVVEGAAEIKYIDSQIAIALPTTTNWLINENVKIKHFDNSWHPDRNEQPYIYVFGNNQYKAEDMPTIQYVVPGAVEIKYVSDIVATLDIDKTHWVITQDIDEDKFDFSWIPNPNDPPYIYRWGNKYISNKYKATIEYIVPGATEIKYMTDDVVVLPEYDRWEIPKYIDIKSFDFTWRPDPLEPNYIWEFGTQWQETGGPKYVVPGATDIKYVKGQKATIITSEISNNWTIPLGIDISDFDFTWHPDEKDGPYIYVFGTQHQKTGGPRYTVAGGTELKFISFQKVKKLPNIADWQVPDDVDITNFDFSWHPDDTEPPYIYEFSTQHQKNGGPRYIVPGAAEVKIVESIIAKRLPDQTNFRILVDHSIESFDYSWHPDNTEEPYIYIFGNQHHDARQMPTIEYRMPGAVKEKYIMDIVAKLAQNKTHWITPDNIDDSEFDYSWIPNPHDEPYIYEFNTQHQNNGGPRYVVDGANDIKYVYSDKIKAKPTSLYWQCVIKIKSFDYSWHPDNTEQPYIYVFGNEQYSAEVMPVIKYVMPGATELKYVNTIVAKTFADMTKWRYNSYIDLDKFDFEWLPDPGSPPYIYQFGTQWQKTGGPIYTVEGATEVKYIDSQKAVRLSDKSNWIIPKDLDVTEFDFSWHPDDTEPAFIYEFGTQHQKTDGPRYIVEDAFETKYVDVQHAIKLSDKTNWKIPSNIDVDSFDFSWHPDSTEEPYDYEFATVWNDVGGPIYHTHNATQKKYIKDIQAKTLVDNKNFKVKIRLEPDSFDFSWVPHPEAPPYIYVFGNQWNRAEKQPTVEYHVPGATEIKYVHDIIGKVAQDKNKFEMLLPIIESEFDFSWRPDPYDDLFIYVFGNTQYPGEVMPTVRYVVDGATEIKYIDDVKARLASNMTHWVEKIPVDKSKFDYGWVPDPKAPPYIYVFGNQWNIASVEPTLEYVVPGATEYKYIDDIVATVLPNKNNFKILHPIIEDSFDFSWRPNPKEQPYIYAFGNTQYSAEKMPTILYRVSGATDYKYDNSFVATLAQNYDRFTEIIPVDRTSFDYSWVPDPHDEPYIYVFGNQWNVAEIEPTLEYRVKGAIQKKYMLQVANVLPDYNKWRELIKVRSDFDYSWRPDPTSPPYIYVFGNQWNTSEVEPTLEYHVKNATERKYIHDITAEVVSDMTNWVIPEGINTDDFDFSWRPNPGSPPYIYQFGTLFDDNDGPIYKTKSNNGEIIKIQRVTKKHDSEFVEIPKYYIQTTLEDLIEQHVDELFWALNKNINYSSFNFSWRPNIEQARFVHVFGSPDAVETQTYFVNSKLYKQGFTQFNFVTGDVKAESEYLADLFIQPDIFMIDRGNIEAKERFEKLQERFPGIQKTRYLNSWVDTIYRCLNRSTTQLTWILNSELDYSNFDFKYYPNPWQLKMVHVFGTQWSHWGTTYLLNKDTFPEDTKYVKIIEHLSNLNFVKNRTAKATNCLYDIYLIDHGNSEAAIIREQLTSKSTGKNVITVPYNKSYLQSFKDILSLVKLKDNHIWVCSSVCDYKNFDMTYICDPFAKENLHVFPSDKQKFGDTFLIDVNKLKSLVDDMNLLEDYDKINYNNHIRTKRLQAPEFILDNETNIDSVKKEFDFPYAIFKTIDNSEVSVNYDEPLCLWADHTKNIEILSTGGTILTLPKEAKLYVDNELYDYPYIAKSKRIVKSKPLDIVFLSNGESCAEDNYKHLLKITKHLPNKVVRVDGVNGRVSAYHAAAEASNTPWMFTVFAKLKINEHFDFSWQPDRLQIPKHYIFTAKNPVNELIYGHQAMIAYNKKLALGNIGKGLDFTLDDPHESIDILSGIANFNTDAYSTWRTAFREVIKLKSDYADIALERLNIWTTIAKGAYADSCIQGAKDAVEYYDNVMGDIEELKKSYEWSWLQDYYRNKYK